MHFKRFFFAYVLLFLIILFISSAFLRFVYLKDFVVSYKSSCDATISSCFTGCIDEECTEIYPYKLVQKHTTDIIKQCGIQDIESCDTAHYCLDTDKICKISFCNTLVEDCYVNSDDSLDI